MGGQCHPLTSAAGEAIVIIKSYGFDERAKWATEEKAQTLSVGGGAGWYSLVMAERSEPIVLRDDITIKVDGGRCLCPRHNAQGASDNDLSANSRDD